MSQHSYEMSWTKYFICVEIIAFEYVFNMSVGRKAFFLLLPNILEAGAQFFMSLDVTIKYGLKPLPMIGKLLS